MKAVWPEFYSQVKTEYKKDAKVMTTRDGKAKPRKCLKCRIDFKSSHYGHRVCGPCAAQNDRASKLAEISYI